MSSAGTDANHDRPPEIVGGAVHLTPVRAALLLTLITLAVFLPVTGYDFVNYDDEEYITLHPTVLKGVTLNGIVEVSTQTHHSNWHPLTSLSHMLDVELFGLNAGAHHSVNLLFHLVNTLLLFILLTRMTRAAYCSAFVAALFAVHPLHVESVAWISERKDVLSTTFWLLATLAYVRYTERPSGRRYLGVALLFGIGLMAKPMVVTLPFTLLLLDFWPLNRMKDRASAIKLMIEKLPLLGLSLITCVLTYTVQLNAGAVKTFEEFPLAHRLTNATVTYALYLFKTLWPVNLAAFYPFPLGGPPLWKVGFALLVLVGISLFAFRSARTKPYLLVGWLWFLGTLVPVIGLVQVGAQAMADRYTYVPLIGIFIAATWLVAGWAAHRAWPTRVIATASIACVVIAGLFSAVQVRHWRDSVSLWSHAVDATRDNYLAHQNLGVAIVADEPVEAAAHFTEALRIKPDYADAHGNMGSLYLTQNRYDEALDSYRTAIALDPASAVQHGNLGLALLRLEDLDGAIASLLTAVSLDPRQAQPRQNLGDAFLKQGDPGRAVEHYAAALSLEPSSKETRCNLAIALIQLSRYTDARGQLAHILDRAPEYIPAQHALGVAAASQGDFETARAAFTEVLRLDPSHAQARANLTRLEAEAGATAEGDPGGA